MILDKICLNVTLQSINLILISNLNSKHIKDIFAFWFVGKQIRGGKIMANKVYVCGTLYHLYVSSLKNVEPGNQGIKSLLIVNDHTPNLSSMAKKLVENNFFSDYLYIPFYEIKSNLKLDTGLIKRSLFRNRNLIKYVEDNSDIRKQFDFIGDSEINLFYNRGINSFYFLTRFKKNTFIQLESGIANYTPMVSILKAFKRRFILKTPQGDGRDKQIKKIEVKFPENLPPETRKKGVKLDLQDIIESLENSRKQELLNIFSQGHSFSLNNNKKLILITQPLSEDKFITEDYKISLYNKILNEYASDFEVYLKPHPREITEYKDKFDIDINELPRNFPLEILNFSTEIVFDKGITIFSGALNNLENIGERIFLGQDYDKKLIQRKRII